MKPNIFLFLILLIILIACAGIYIILTQSPSLENETLKSILPEPVYSKYLNAADFSCQYKAGCTYSVSSCITKENDTVYLIETSITGINFHEYYIDGNGAELCRRYKSIDMRYAPPEVTGICPEVYECNVLAKGSRQPSSYHLFRLFARYLGVPI